MSIFQKYEEKIRKYLSKLSNLNVKNKLKRLVLRIGISSSDEFDLGDREQKKILFPCHLGILFLGEYDIILYENAKSQLERIFDSFFFNIKNLGEFEFSDDILIKGVKEEYTKMNETSEKVLLHPTNKFYGVLINERERNHLDMIIAITNLPIYSSKNENIIFLFGETHLMHQCCVVSTLKLKEQYYGREEDEYLYEKRMKKEIAHEIGHLILGPEHCVNGSCIMRFCKDINEVDHKSLELCNNCKTILKDLRVKFNF